MTKPLSPSTQAVLDAFLGNPEYREELEDDRHYLAAALRAVAGKVFPINYVIIDNCQYEVPNSEREQILAIAAELENCK